MSPKQIARLKHLVTRTEMKSIESNYSKFRSSGTQRTNRNAYFAGFRAGLVAAIAISQLDEKPGMAALGTVFEESEAWNESLKVGA